MEAKELFAPNVDKGICIEERIRVMKALVFDTWDYMEEIDPVVSCTAYIDTLLIEHFTNVSGVPKSLKQILYGYIPEEYRPVKIKVVSNKEGVVYLPQIGYYHLAEEGINSYYYFCVDNKVQIFDFEGKEIEFTFEGLSFVKEVEVLKYIHPLLYSKYLKIEEPIVYHNFQEIKSQHEKYLTTLEESLNEMALVSADNYDNLLLEKRRIFISEKEVQNNSVNGMLMVSTKGVALQFS